MKQLYAITASLCLLITFTISAQTIEFGLSFIGVNSNTGNYQFGLVATPSSTITDGITADMVAGFYIPSGLTLGNFVTGNSGIPANQWTSNFLGNNANGDAYYLSRVESGASIILNGDGPFELVLFDVIANPNPETGSIFFIENGDPIFDVDFTQNYINIDYGSTGNFLDVYSQNNPSTSLIMFDGLKILSNEDSGLISLYPNPVSETLFLDSFSREIDKIEIASINGQVVKTINKDFEKIDVKSLENGIYFLRISSGDKEKILRFVKN